MKKILILASNPRKDLNLDREIRDLKDVIERSRNGEQFEVKDALAVRVRDLQGLLLKHQPQIVHFCGHGSGEQGLVFEDDEGREQLVATDALFNLFELFTEQIECVLLNACYSETQADAIVQHINYVVGMSQEIRDDAAIAFATGFYQALGYGRSVEQSYKFGRIAIQLQISGTSATRSIASDETRKLEVANITNRVVIPEHLKPVLKKKANLTIVSGDNVAKSIQFDTQLLEMDKAREREVTRRQLIDTLYKLIPVQFEQLVLILNPPAGVIPPLSAPQGDRVSALLNWAEAPGGCGLLKVQQELDSILNPQKPFRL
jgi:hypothetical protein